MTIKANMRIKAVISDEMIGLHRNMTITGGRGLIQKMPEDDGLKKNLEG